MQPAVWGAREGKQHWLVQLKQHTKQIENQEVGGATTCPSLWKPSGSFTTNYIKCVYSTQKQEGENDE